MELQWAALRLWTTERKILSAKMVGMAYLENNTWISRALADTPDESCILFWNYLGKHIAAFTTLVTG